MTYYLFLDDERNPQDVTWVNIPQVPYQIVRCYQEFLDTILTHGVPLFVSFDHDLADAHYVVMLKETQMENLMVKESVSYGPEKTGYECAKWLVDYCVDHNVTFPEYTVHSMNPIGSKRIKDYISEAKKHLNI